MDAREAQAAFAALASEIGRRADVYASLDVTHLGSTPLRATIYPKGLIARVEQAILHCSGEDWASLLANARAEWAAYRSHYEQETIREMALEIIRVTAEHGECSDAALRMKFSAEDVTRYADEACSEADRMASNGPFSVTRTEARSNAEAAE